MKYFTVTYISQKTLHPEGYKTFTEFLSAETKHAAKLKALEVLSEKDPDCCMMYKVPRLNEISEEVYLSKTEQQLDIVDDMAVQRYCALLALFGEQECYDEDEVRDADDFLACPDDEPEIYARYSALQQKVSEYRAVMPKDAHLDDIRAVALRVYRAGDVVHKSASISLIANNNNELPPEVVENSVEREGESAETVAVTESEISVINSPDIDAWSSESDEANARDCADLELDIACALLPVEVDFNDIPAHLLEISQHRLARGDSEITRWYQALQRFPDILAGSRPALFALIFAAGHQKLTMTSEEIDAYLVESLGFDDEKDVPRLPDYEDYVAAAPMMPGEGAEAFPDADPETTIADAAEDEPAVVAESDIPPSPETEVPEFLRDLPLVNGSVEDGRPFTSENPLNARLADIPVGGSLVLWGLSNALYHAVDGYSSTHLRLAHRGGIAALDWYKNAPRKSEGSPALLLGTALHTAILEPERFATQYACAPSVNLRTNEGKQTLAAFEAGCAEHGMTPIKRDDFDTVCLMRDSALAYPTVAALLENGVAELSLFWRMENGLLLKVRPDWLGEFAGAPFLLDIKTTDDVLDFGQSVEKFGYHMQAAFYRLVVEKVFGVAVDFAFCAVGKRPDCGRYPVLLGMLDEEDEAEAAFQVNTTLAIMVKGANTPVQVLATLSRPWWAKQADRKRQRWLWYAWEPRLKRIMAHAFGSRSKKKLHKLLKLLSRFRVAFWCTDGYRAYNDALPKAKHIVGKLYTQRIERENLTLRNRLKRPHSHSKRNKTVEAYATSKCVKNTSLGER